MSKRKDSIAEDKAVTYNKHVQRIVTSLVMMFVISSLIIASGQLDDFGGTIGGAIFIYFSIKAYKEFQAAIAITDEQTEQDSIDE